MKYEVTARKRAGYSGFNRAGLRFRSDVATTIDSDDLSPEDLAAIRHEKMLRCVRAEKPKGR